MSIKDRFGHKLKEIRLAKGLSQEKLMLISGIHRTYISEVERGDRNISVVNIEKLAIALGIDIREFFDFVD